jgi:hypothetical protein
VAAESVATVEVARVPLVEGLHGNGKDSVIDLDEQVVVRSHQTEAHASPFEPCSHSAETPKELEAVCVVAKMRRRRPDAVRVDVEHVVGDVL